MVVITALALPSAEPATPPKRVPPARVPLLRREHLTPSRIRAACVRAGEFLLRVQQPSGRFHYTYDPKQDRLSERTYNLPRHAGTTFALLQLARASGQNRFSASALKALDWLLGRCKRRVNEDGEVLFPVRRSRAKVGSVALAALAFAEGADLLGRPDLTTRAASLARCLQQCQRADGSFGWYYQHGTHPAYFRKGGESEYYPGEALLALVRVYRLTRKPAWLHCAHKTAQDLVGGARDRRRHEANLPVPLHDHWLLQALEELYRVDPNPRWADYALFTARAVVDAQLVAATARYPDAVGGWYGPTPRLTPAATRLEGLTAAYRLARLAGRDATWLVVPIRRTTRFLLQLQFRPEHTYEVPRPDRADGGFPCSVRRLTVRIDYVQHSISGLLGAADVLEAPGPTSRPGR